MDYIVIDFEFNQPYDFDDNIKTPAVPQCPFEIIQIGMVKMDKDFNFTDQMNILIKPQLYKRMHPFVENITGLTDEILADKETFPEIYSAFEGFAGGVDNVLCSWGSNDIRLLYRNVLFYNINHDNLTKKYINVQAMASKELKVSSGRSIGLKNAATAFNLEQEATFHDALNDAVYTGKIFKIIGGNMSVTPSVINLGDLTQNKDVASYIFDSKQLYKEAEKLYGRRLSNKEKSILKNVYMMGHNGEFNR